MKKSSLALGAILFLNTSSLMSAEFLVSGVIEYGRVYDSQTYITRYFDGHAFEITFSYSDDPPSSVYDYGSYTLYRWWNTVTSYEINIVDQNGFVIYTDVQFFDYYDYDRYVISDGAKRDAPGQYSSWVSVDDEYEEGLWNYSNYVYVAFHSNDDYLGDLQAHPTAPSQQELEDFYFNTANFLNHFNAEDLFGNIRRVNLQGLITSRESVINRDRDGDGVPDDEDQFPDDPTESSDSDGDGVGDIADAFPNDPTETLDSDGDGVGNNSDDFPYDPYETTDSDSDGVGNNGDAFPNDPGETRDSDGDRVGDNADVFPFDQSESSDNDGDGIGDNADQNDNSDLSVIVTIEGVDSGVANALYADGNTLADLVAAASTSCKLAAENHGHYVSCMGAAIDALVDNGVVTNKDKGALQNTSARTNINKK